MTDHMMKQPTVITDLLEYAGAYHGDKKIISKMTDGYYHRYSYKDALCRSKKLAKALIQAGIKKGDRVATLAWNTYRHFECYYGISGIGAICHTINPRLYLEQIEYIINHAKDSIILVDTSFLHLIEKLKDKIPSVTKIIVMDDDISCVPSTALDIEMYEEFININVIDFKWPNVLGSDDACLCYTSGTTGNPKGVMYTQESTVLHAFASRNPDALNISSDTVVMPVVPMYHVCAWGTPYIAPMAGATLVLPGDGMDGMNLFNLIDKFDVDLAFGVPTVWLGLLEYMKKHHLKVPLLERLGVGGAASPRSLVKTFDTDFDVYWMPIWGMTETSPLATFGGMTKDIKRLPKSKQYDIQTSAGKPMFGIDLELFTEEGHVVPHDGVSRGYLRVKGPWVLNSYYKEDKPDSFFTDEFGEKWFDTGDISVIDSLGYMKVVDRAKDVVKSGGEWISSLDLENSVLGCEGIKEACVIGVKHKKWDERPLMFIVRKENSQIETKDIYTYLSKNVAKWWLPDDILFLDELPHTATGKLHKLVLKEKYKDHLI